MAIPWPARSPDLSPIEHVWDMIGRRVEDFPTPVGTLAVLRIQFELKELGMKYRKQNLII
jgi:transposase